MLGREIELPIDLIYGPLPQMDKFRNETGATNANGRDLRKLMFKVQQNARKNISLASDRQKHQYDIRARQHSYKTGDVVWLYTFTRTKNLSPKLQNSWEGPYIITEVIPDVIYKIKKSNTKIYGCSP